ncbi:MAG: ABC transporter permease [Lachnospiraceae bacterium]
MRNYISNHNHTDIKSQFMSNRMAFFGTLLLVIMIGMAMLIPLISPYHYSEQNVSIQNLGASISHLFGTDKFGRDIFTRVWYGAGISLCVGIFSTILNVMIGIVLGGIAGYAGGKTDLLLMRFTDIIASIPSLLYVILIMLVLGTNMGSMILGICVSGWISLARVVRGEIMKLKEMEFCLAAKVSGVSSSRILFHHLLKNAAGPIIVTATLMIPQAIFTESFLSFVGVGIAAPMASLGTLIQEARSQILVYPMQIVYPVLVLCMLSICLNLIGDGLLKAFNPKGEERL